MFPAELNMENMEYPTANKQKSCGRKHKSTQ